MRFVAIALGVAVAMFARGALGQPIERTDRVESQRPPRALPDESPRAPGESPRAQTGFQVAFRTGASFPAGKISGAAGDKTASVFAWQVPLLVEIGGKPIKHLFIGGYAGAAFGGVSDGFERSCNGVGVSFSSRSVRVGIEAIWYFLPGRWVDPWVGYGFGWESSTVVGEANKQLSTQSLSGLELAHLTAGLDVRLSHTIGVGPYFDIGLGRYGNLHQDASSVADSSDRDIEDKSLHEWFTLGARLVIFP